jgi:hypothetical protein
MLSCLLLQQLISVVGLWIVYNYLTTNKRFGHSERHERFHRLTYNVLISFICIAGFLNFIAVTLDLFGEGNQVLLALYFSFFVLLLLIY